MTIAACEEQIVRIKHASFQPEINHYQLEVGSMVIWLEAGSQAKAPSPTECG